MKNKKKKILFFYNPFSGNGLFKNNLDHITERVQNAGYQIVPVRAGGGTPMEDAFKEMNVDDYRQIMIAGGDGTINICVNAMLKCEIDLPIAILPAGTANDFAYYLDLPHDLDSMLDIALGDCYTPADVGVCNGLYFINVAAIGNMVDVSQKTDPTLKNTLGVLSYYIKGATEMANLKALPVKITAGDKVYEEEMFFMLVMNGISAGGFKNLSPQAEINDGKFNVLVFRKMPYIEIPHIFFSVLRGSHMENKNVLCFAAEKLVVESELDIATDVDGEHGAKLPLHFSMLPRRLKIFTEKNFSG